MEATQVQDPNCDIIVTDGTEHVVLEAVSDKSPYGEFTGSTKWFNDKLGYGFITICDGVDKGKDIFVHHSGINPLNSNYKTLRKGEYIQFNIINGINGLQAVDVTGIKGGPLMCDYVTSKRLVSGGQSYTDEYSASQPPPPTGWQPTGWQTIAKKPKNNFQGQSAPMNMGQRPRQPMNRGPNPKYAKTAHGPGKKVVTTVV